MLNNCTSMISMVVCVGYYHNGSPHTFILHITCIFGIVIVVITVSNNFYQWTRRAPPPPPRSTQEREKLKFCLHRLTAIAQLAPSPACHKQGLCGPVDHMANNMYVLFCALFLLFFLVAQRRLLFQHLGHNTNFN